MPTLLPKRRRARAIARQTGNVLIAAGLGFAVLSGVQILRDSGVLTDGQFVGAVPITDAAAQDARYPAAAHGTYVANCSAARSMGIAPIHRAQPAYRPHLDRDKDGIACEPYSGR